MKSTAAEISATILRESKARNIEVSNLKLQKLLYYCEAWNLALTEKSLFPEPIEAWIHGPVVNNVFHSYKEFRWTPIDSPRCEPSNDSEIVKHVNAVLNAYGSFEAIQLERLTHSEKPWLEARNGLEPDIPSREHINRTTMKNFYSAQIV